MKRHKHGSPRKAAPRHARMDSLSEDRRAQGWRESYSAPDAIAKRNVAQKTDAPKQFALRQGGWRRTGTSGATAAIGAPTRRLLAGHVLAVMRCMIHCHRGHHGHAGHGHGTGRRPHRSHCAQDKSQGDHKPADDTREQSGHGGDSSLCRPNGKGLATLRTFPVTMALAASFAVKWSYGKSESGYRPGAGIF